MGELVGDRALARRRGRIEVAAPEDHVVPDRVRVRPDRFRGRRRLRVRMDADVGEVLPEARFHRRAGRVVERRAAALADHVVDGRRPLLLLGLLVGEHLHDTGVPCGSLEVQQGGLAVDGARGWRGETSAVGAAPVGSPVVTAGRWIGPRRSASNSCITSSVARRSIDHRLRRGKACVRRRTRLCPFGQRGKRSPAGPRHRQVLAELRLHREPAELAVLALGGRGSGRPSRPAGRRPPRGTPRRRRCCGCRRRRA